MTWLRQSDTLWRDYEFTQLTDGAQALWHRANSWIADQLSDGLIPESAIRGLNTRRRYIQELEQAGYWIWQPTGGWLARGWQEIIQSKASVVAKRAEQSQRDRAKSTRQKSSSLTPPSPSPSPFSSVNQAADTETSVRLDADPYAAAMVGRRKLGALGEFDWDHRGKHAHALSQLSRKPEAEWLKAAKVIRAQLELGNRRLMTPQSILDHWDTHYALGEAPGQRKPPVAAKPQPAGAWAKPFQVVR
jgi:hypothetical protein